MIVYLAGPINGCTDAEANGWRDQFITDNPGHTYLDPMVRDYRGREAECVAEIVEGDKDDIDGADLVVAYCWQVSWGTGMEIFYAHSQGIPVVAVVPEGMRVSPWLRYHTVAVVPTLSDVPFT